MTCEQIDELLLEYVDGDLAEDRRDEVRRHLDGCPPCQARLRSTRAIFGDLSAARSLDNRVRRPEAQPNGAALGPGHRGLQTLGDFSIVEELGRGGMGVVYKARQTSLGRIVALKVLASGALQSARAISRFQHEAQAAARLHHTNIVPVYAQGEADGHYFYAMELIEGAPLSAIIRAEAAANPTARIIEKPHPTAPGLADAGTIDASAALPSAGPPTTAAHTDTLASISLTRAMRTTPRFRRLARLFAEVADALHHAHTSGIVHRDIKPQNLLLGADDKLHVTDFGLARLLDEPGLTRTHEMVGTPSYMAPEQIAPERGPIDGRTDVYALGVTLYETLTHRRPFEGAAYDQIIHRILETEPTRPRRIDRSIPRDLETICLRAMEKSPAARFPTAAAMASDLQRYATDFPIASRPISPFGRAWRWVKRNQAKTAAGAALALVALLTPLLIHFVRVRDTRLVESAWGALLDNYQQTDGPKAELERVSWLSGRSREWTVAKALTLISQDPAASTELLRPLTAKSPPDFEADYLLAWATMRAARSGKVELEREATQLVAETDKLRATSTHAASGAAHFFRGQALFAEDPEEALNAFRDAIAAHPRSFPLAMVHRARSINQLLYLRRDDRYFTEAESTLNQLQMLRPKDPYVLYLLSTTYRLRGEILAREAELAHARGDERERDLRSDFEKMHSEAADYAARAIAEHQSSPYGYMAAAWAAESRGDFRAAADFWNALPTAAREKSASVQQDRTVYLMRLYFWLPDVPRALEAHHQRYAATRENDPDARIWEALLRKTDGDAVAAERLLREAAEKFQSPCEFATRVAAGYQICGLTPPAALFTADAATIPTWESVFLAYCRGESTWDALQTAIDADKPTRDERTRRLARSSFHRAAQALSAGDRSEAQTWFRRSAEYFDREGYCFRGRMIAEKLARDPAWPGWRSPGSEKSTSRAHISGAAISSVGARSID